jgi:hypothetical protein
MFPIFAGNSASTGYNFARSVRLRSSASASLSKTFGTPTNNKIWTISIWAKRGNIGSRNFIASTNTTGGSNAFYFDWDGDALEFGEYTTSWQWRLVTTQVFRDPSAWYHIVVAVDTTQATSSNRVKMYVNGSQVTAFSTASYPTQNLNTYWNQSGQAARFGELNGASIYFDGYITEVNFIDGQALTPSSFGSTNTLTGVWQPAPYTGSYGTNGFILDFEDNSALTTSSNVGLGKDTSGNGNYWTTNNISITSGVTYDSMTDVPTLTSATASNFAVLNPLFISTSAGTQNATLTQGNLAFVGNITNDSVSRSTIGVTTGSFYCEITIGNVSAIQDGVGIAYTQSDSTRTSGVIYRTNGDKCVNNSVSAYGSSYVATDVIGIALNATSNQVTFYKNNVSQGAISFTPTTAIYFSTYGINSAGSFSGNINFGQRPFTYTPPSGFVSLNTFNLPDSTIVKGNTVMDATLYTGTGASQAVTNAGAFKPDLVWLKIRSGAANHILIDSVRGVTNYLNSNTTNAEASSADQFLSFNSNGFTVGANTTGGNTNQSGSTYVGWQWQAGQGSTSSNTNGTITSTVSVNASAGFSVSTFTATGATATVGHGLGVAPSFMISKARSGTGAWILALTYSGFTYSSDYFQFDTGAKRTDGASTVWVTAPTSSVFSIGSSFGNGVTFVNYCWTPIAGYSAFGSYTGNGSTDGPFVFTGFRPRWILWKSAGTAQDWFVLDTARDTYNLSSLRLCPDLSVAEASNSGAYTDLLSNGFKFRTSDNSSNASGVTYIYMAFAENPFKNALAR